MSVFYRLGIFKLIILHLFILAAKITASTHLNEKKLENLHAKASELLLATGPFTFYPELEEMNTKLTFTNEPAETLTAFSELSPLLISRQIR